MANGNLRMANGDLRMANGEWRMGMVGIFKSLVNGEWRIDAKAAAAATRYSLFAFMFGRNAASNPIAGRKAQT